LDGVCNINLLTYMAILWIKREFCAILSAMQVSDDVMIKRVLSAKLTPVSSK